MRQIKGLMLVALIIGVGWGADFVAASDTAATPQLFGLSFTDAIDRAPQPTAVTVGAFEVPEFRLAAEDATGTPAQVDEAVAADEEGYKDESGNDPRDFRNKFMPYYRYTELRNGFQQHEWVLFGFWAITPKIGMTYEIPLKYVDASDAVPSGFGLPRGPGPGGPLPGMGVTNIGPNIDPYEFGLGDVILRAFARVGLEHKFTATWGPRKGETLGLEFMPLVETTLPTNTDDILGNDVWVISPGFVGVVDTPTYGFIAGMFFYDTNLCRSSDEAYVSRFRARIFWLQALAQPGPAFTEGWYMMPEFQPIYDMREGHFSLWIGPEFGKVIPLGEDGAIESMTIYAKPGWGWASHALPTDREFTMEVGIRLFF